MSTDQTLTPIIEVNNVVKDFKAGGGFGSTETFRALDHINFKLYPGRTLALVGESGCGKSTCARLITKVHEPSSGEILFNGTNINDIKGRKDTLEYRSKVQMVFQDPFGSLNPTHTIKHHLTRPLLIHGRVASKKDVQPKLEELMKLVELPIDDLNKYPHQLSGGQRQRVNLARAIAVGAEVILADEPTSMLDVSIRLGVLNLMKEMKEKMGIGFLYITHDLATAHYIAEETAVMYRGKIVEWGDTQSILRNPTHPYTRLLISAVPDPDLPFANLVQTEPNYSVSADKIRALSIEPVDGFQQLGDNHFVANWKKDKVA
ncbi:ABC transporter ATP-binding protein [Photobacterium aphoticum]|uniref:Oligopeptide transport ATP-binding protein OppF n=1 Tax=Photobacterium aphoticum TaxID=754436 RepID=A0A090QJQ5_9GAMM|nr:ATP-binding cassette domain-containing protein [Photobacterium aphoticum]KLV02101.1 peptide ABC transporter ATPase [Photobacterium aphoticum]PSU60356.1 ABC transporter ATP-binding protein [Photobacterium aphoticum]GAL03146.1 oligopeptide transport ATP-binding protein OppF [Photobacterium aphoticum]GHA35185.1 dipeptide/oligopeptide/nickel ABC transporter ATP-binding protein [Photobacterium aphoticum]